MPVRCHGTLHWQLYFVRCPSLIVSAYWNFLASERLCSSRRGPCLDIHRLPMITPHRDHQASEMLCYSSAGAVPYYVPIVDDNTIGKSLQQWDGSSFFGGNQTSFSIDVWWQHRMKITTPARRYITLSGEYALFPARYRWYYHIETTKPVRRYITLSGDYWCMWAGGC
jgi:hypothetical protein